MNEAETRAEYVDPALKAAELSQQSMQLSRRPFIRYE